MDDEEKEENLQEEVTRPADSSNKVTLVLILLALFFVVAVGYSVFKDKSTGQTDGSQIGLESTDQSELSAQEQDMAELEIEDLEQGTGEEAVLGKTVTVHYTGTLTDGTKFDSSVDRGQPFEFVLGSGYVIAGWDQGVSGMKVGGKRKLTIPPHLGYGDRDLGTIPPNSTLVFEIELLSVE